MRRILLSLLLCTALASQAGAATYYASKISGQWKAASGAWPTAGSDNCSANDIEGCLTTAGASNTLVLDGGASGTTYTRTDFDTDDNIYFTANSQTLRGPISSDPDFTNHGGEVILDATGSASLIVYTNTKTGCTVSYLTLINATGASGRGVSTDADNTTIQYCKFRNNLFHIRAGATGTTTNIRYNDFQGEATTANSEIYMLTGTGTVNVAYNIFRPYGSVGGGTTYGYGGAVIIQGTGVYNIYNNVFAAPRSGAVVQFGTPASGTVNIKNNIVIGGGAGSISTGGIFQCVAAQTCTVSNNLVGISAVTPVAPVLNADTEANNIYAASPYYTASSRHGYVLFSVDDYTSNTWAYLYGSDGTDGVIAQFYSRGIPLVWYIDVKNASGRAGYAANIAWAKARGVEIAQHGRTSSDLTYTGKIFDVTKAAETITVSRANDNIVLSGGGTVTGFRAKTLAAIKTELEGFGATVTGTANYNTYLVGGISSNVYGEAISDNTAVNELDILVGDHTQGFLKTEIVDGKSELEAVAGVGAGTVKSFSYPFGTRNATVKAAALAAGLTSGRYTAIDTTSSQHISNLDRFVLANFTSTDIQADTTSGDATADIQTNTNGLMACLAETGSIATILSHSTSELTAAEWGVVLDEVVKWNGKVTYTLNMQDAITAIMAFATDDGDGTLSYAWTDSSDYRLLSSSPAINAGVDVGLTSDYRGKPVPIGSAPDIGAYEFSPGDPGFGGAYRGRMGIHWMW